MFGRIGNLFRAFLNLFVGSIERQNPEALLDLEKEHLRDQISSFNQGLASHAGLAEGLMGQVRKLESDQKDLTAKATANLKAGNRAAAGQYALRLQTVERELDENRQQLTQAEATYQNMVKARNVAVASARAKMESLGGAIADMKMNKAMAEMQEMAASMIGQIGGGGDTLNRLHDMVEEERQKAAGRARVAKDSIDMTDVNLKESEQNALADQALAEFAARQGVALEPAQATPAAPRAMGSVADSRATGGQAAAEGVAEKN